MSPFPATTLPTSASAESTEKRLQAGKSFRAPFASGARPQTDSRPGYLPEPFAWLAWGLQYRPRPGYATDQGFP